MEIKLEVVRSVTLQGKKPWSRFVWLREFSDSDISSGLFLLDNMRISRLSRATGRNRRSLPALPNVQLALTCASPSGAVLAGLTVHGHMFTWLQPSHQLATYTSPLSTPAPHLEDLHGCHLFVSDSAEQALLVTRKLDLYLWELRDGLHSEWWKLPVPDDIGLPHTGTRHTAIDAGFYVHQLMGECCECDIVYTNQETDETTIAHCLLTWEIMPHTCCTSSTDVSISQADVQDSGLGEGDGEGKVRTISRASRPLLDRTNLEHTAASAGCDQSVPATRSIPVHVAWKSCTLSQSNSPHHSPRGRGCYVAKLSPTGRVTAVAVNHDTAVDTHIVFTDLLNEVSASSHVYPSSSNVMTGRTFWITSLAWSGDGLLLAAMTHRGCLALLPRFGPPLTLVSSGCGVEMGPARFLPLHPLITVQNKSGVNITDHETSESSERDPLRQRFSVASHPCLPVLLCSDGYCLTILKLPSSTTTLPRLVCSLVNVGHRILGLADMQPFQTDCTGDKESVHFLPSTESGPLNVSELSSVGIGRDLASSRYPPSIAEAGKVHSLEVGKSHSLSHTQSFGQVSECEREQLVRMHLIAAWSLLLSAGNFQPGNGIYPHVMSASQVKSLLSEVNVVRNITVTTLASFHSSVVVDHEQEYGIVSTLSLARLDQCDHNCHKMVYKLASSYLMSLLSGLLQEHRRFTSSLAHTVLSVQTYTESVTSGLRQFWEMFNKILVQVTEIYGQSDSKLQKTFSLVLRVFGNICSILSEDMLACDKLAQAELTSGPESQGLQKRESSFLHHSVNQCVSEASALLCGVRNILTTYFNHRLNTTVVITGLSGGKHSGSEKTAIQSGLQEHDDHLRLGKYKREQRTSATSSPSLEHVTPDTEPTGGVESMTTVTSSLEHVTPDTGFTAESVMTDMTLSSSLEHVTADTVSTSGTDSMTVVTPSLHLGEQSLPLLKIHEPDVDMCMTHTEVDQAVPHTLLTTAFSALSVTVSPSSTASDGGAVAGSGDSSTWLGSGLEFDLTDSQSTGELPSQLTFSVGELGSAVRPHTTTDIPSLSQTTPVASPLASDATAHENMYPLLHLQLSEDTPHSVEQPPHTIKQPSSKITLDPHLQPSNTLEQPLPSNEQPPPSNEQPPPSNEQPPPSNKQPPPSNEQPPPSALANSKQSLASTQESLPDIAHLSPSTEYQQPNTEQSVHSVGHHVPTEQLLHNTEQLPPHPQSSVDHHQPPYQPPRAGGAYHTSSSSETILEATATSHTVEEMQWSVCGGGGGGITEEVDGTENGGGEVQVTVGGNAGGVGCGVNVQDGGNRECSGGDSGGEVGEGGEETAGGEVGEGGGRNDGERDYPVGAGEGSGKNAHSNDGNTQRKGVSTSSEDSAQREEECSAMPQRKTLPRLASEAAVSMSDQPVNISAQAIPGNIQSRAEDIGRIVRSEIKRFLQVQQHQLMKILSTTNSHSTPTPVIEPQDSCQNSEQERQNSSSSSHLSIRHLHRDTHPTAAPPPLLLATPPLLPPHHTTTHPPHHTTTHPPHHSTTLPPHHTTTLPPHHTTTHPPHHSTTLPPHHTTTHPPHHSTTQPPVTHLDTHHRRTESEKLVSSPLLLQFDISDTREIVMPEVLPAVTSARQSRAMSGSMPLLTLDHTGDDGLLPPLVQVPTAQQVPSQPPTTTAHGISLPTTILPTPHLHHPVAHNTGTLAGRPIHGLHTPLPLLVPTNDHLPSLPPLPHIMPPGEPHPPQLLPASVLLHNQPPELLLHKANQFTGVSRFSSDERSYGDTQSEDQPYSDRPTHSKETLYSDTQLENGPHGDTQLQGRPHGDTQPSGIDGKPGVNGACVAVDCLNQLSVVGRTTCAHISSEDSKTISSQHMEEQSSRTTQLETSPECLHVPPYCSPDSQPTVCGSASVPGLTQETPSSCDQPDIIMKPPNLPNDHREDVPSLEGTNNKQLTPSTGFLSSESEGSLVEQPSGQTAYSTTKTVTCQASAELVKRKFMRIIDIGTDEGDIPSPSSEEGSTAVSDEHSLQGEALLEDVLKEGESQGVSVGRGEKGESGVGHSRTVDSGHSGTADRDHNRTEAQGHSSTAGQDHSGTEGWGHSGTVGQGYSEEEGRINVARRKVLNQLEHLECQLSAIESTARTVKSELLVSNQLLGTIDELQAVSVPTIQPHTTHQTLVENHAAPTDTALPVTRRPDKSYITGQPAMRHTQSLPPTDIPAASTAAPPPSHHPPPPPSHHHPPPPPPHHPQPPPSHHHPPSPPSLTPPHHLPTLTQHTTRPVSDSGPRRMSSQSDSRTQHHVHFDHSQRSGLPLSGRHSKQTLKKWVSAKRSERTSSTELSGLRSSQQMVSGFTVKSNSRSLQAQDHMSQRMEDALSLMEDILSAEPSTHDTTYTPHHSTTDNKRAQRHHSTTDRPPVRRGKTSDVIDPAAKHGSVGMRCWSSVEGLTAQEQLKMAHIMASTELSSVSSGSVASHIDWELVDQIIDN